jgi:hypothetical protein
MPSVKVKMKFRRGIGITNRTVVLSEPECSRRQSHVAAQTEIRLRRFSNSAWSVIWTRACCCWLVRVLRMRGWSGDRSAASCRIPVLFLLRMRRGRLPLYRLCTNLRLSAELLAGRVRQQRILSAALLWGLWSRILWAALLWRVRRQILSSALLRWLSGWLARALRNHIYLSGFPYCGPQHRLRTAIFFEEFE